MIQTNRVQIPQGSAFNREQAIELIDLSRQAMNEYDNWNDKNKGPSDDIKIGEKEYTRLATFWSDQRKDQPFGFMAERKMEDGSTEVFAVFRGTRSREEWLHNITPNREPFLDRIVLQEIFETLLVGL